ncbi:hypothetical protein FIBSPDRAFT_894973 [Athelia psychrophila]|uniref:Uncharacterized protein n=1 Tax=Athelia psychrophila TaxID=1759441 RepID=A0A166F8F9_9AGAM|nr:hypothetical protein FIBSPDRAFT_894973 [Fibularhizoctonia sp. CBS 109695]
MVTKKASSRSSGLGTRSMSHTPCFFGNVATRTNRKRDSCSMRTSDATERAVPFGGFIGLLVDDEHYNEQMEGITQVKAVGEGRRTQQGYVASSGIREADRRLGKALLQILPTSLLAIFEVYDTRLNYVVFLLCLKLGRPPRHYEKYTIGEIPLIKVLEGLLWLPPAGQRKNQTFEGQL